MGSVTFLYFYGSHNMDIIYILPENRSIYIIKSPLLCYKHMAKKDNYRSVLLINIDAKILDKIVAYEM